MPRAMAVNVESDPELRGDQNSSEKEALEDRPGQLNRRAEPMTIAE